MKKETPQKIVQQKTSFDILNLFEPLRHPGNLDKVLISYFSENIRRAMTGFVAISLTRFCTYFYVILTTSREAEGHNVLQQHTKCKILHFVINKRINNKNKHMLKQKGCDAPKTLNTVGFVRFVEKNMFFTFV